MFGWILKSPVQLGESRNLRWSFYLQWEGLKLCTFLISRSTCQPVLSFDSQNPFPHWTCSRPWCKDSHIPLYVGEYGRALSVEATCPAHRTAPWHKEYEVVINRANWRHWSLLLTSCAEVLVARWIGSGTGTTTKSGNTTGLCALEDSMRNCCRANLLLIFSARLAVTCKIMQVRGGHFRECGFAVAVA